MPSLLYVALENMVWISTQTAREWGRYWAAPWWYKLRGALAWAWLGSSPNLAIARYWRRTHPDEPLRGGLPEDCGDLTYGELLPGAACQLLEWAQLKAGERVVDLGCGRGILPLVAALAYALPALGVDIIGEYVDRGERAAKLMGVEKLCQFQVLDFCQGPLPSGALYFIPATCLSEESYRALVAQLGAVSAPGQKFFSLSRPLPFKKWSAPQVREIPCTWGPARVYYQYRL